MGFEQDIVVVSSLVDVCAKCGSLLDSRRVFDRMVRHDVVTSLLLGYADTSSSRDLGVSLDLFSAGMDAARCLPNLRTFVAVIKAWPNLAVKEDGKKAVMLLKGRDLRLQAEKLGFGSDDFVAASLGEVAYELFQRFLQRHRDGYSWIAPDGVTFAAALNTCGGMAAIKQAKLGTGELLKTLDKVMALHVQAEKSLSGDKFCRSVGNSVMDLYASHAGLVEKLGVFHKMEGEFMRVSSSSLLCFLTACSHAGLVEKGARCFETMVSKYGASPSLEHYSAMVDLYGRAGKLEAALSLVKGMALEENAGIWRSILGACWKWKNPVVARVAYKLCWI
ncbi:pentatricopeptide repeat-containing protein At5g13270, chloroplastic-like [Selaginella moellendorffii]|uniref:pentatricopeptide repeat-containing protein At5g13270, chloroplastic-like n=1 Tax=Selaginella moellendorffii TaxID=88036 RepID=UPI000D1D10A1|nr:pentatricopeptide repeat-containing protein At5g13270, chloroplastic-like [Selaginella moellendorffii]|eukprot:XP_024540446.1 pentatricopeptide repeat-containing protein At5g13270, chloroplastic-like [Selaginella moellendorffii]